MTKDEIISMAREAGFEHRFAVVAERITELLGRDEYLVNPVVKQSFRTEHVEVMQRFAALVAAKERETCKKDCAELLELSARQARDGDPFEIGREAGHTECVAAIRARGAQ